MFANSKILSESLKLRKSARQYLLGTDMSVDADAELLRWEDQTWLCWTAHLLASDLAQKDSPFPSKLAGRDLQSLALGLTMPNCLMGAAPCLPPLKRQRQS